MGKSIEPIRRAALAHPIYQGDCPTYNRLSARAARCGEAVRLQDGSGRLSDRDLGSWRLATATNTTR
jgi:hypothetical protein